MIKVKRSVFFLLTSIISLLISSCTNPVGEHHPEWKKYFDEYQVTGCIEIFDLKNSKFIDYNPDRCSQRFIPASTFKIFNSLVALETKTIPDTSYIIKWDSIDRKNEDWNHDLSMQQAFRRSALWYYQVIARQIGNDKYAQYMNLIHYGNKNPGGAADSFWVSGDLKISCDEQIEFLKNLYVQQLRISQRSQELVKGMMVLEKNPSYTLSGKTGWGIVKDEDAEGNVHGKKNIGWFVGWIVKADNTYIFALNVESPESSTKNFYESRRAITESCLKELGVM